jgi:nicotinate-nucleotide adenylyltransferase
MRLGIFGGSFDPVHIGHLIAAETAREQAALDRVLFIPARRPPHKPDRSLAAGDHRLTMLQLAIGGNPAFAVLADELEDDGISYTVTTLERLSLRHPQDRLVLLLGPDSIRELPGWHRPDRITELAELRGIERDGLDDLSDLVGSQPLLRLLGTAGVEQLLADRVRMPAVGIRATDIRASIREGRSIRYRLPAAVSAYIAAHRLYQEGVGDSA